jgi:hypothetical protein
MSLTMIYDSAPDFEWGPPLNASQSNDISNDQWLSTWIWMSANQMTLTMIYDAAHIFEC